MQAILLGGQQESKATQYHFSCAQRPARQNPARYLTIAPANARPCPRDGLRTLSDRPKYPFDPVQTRADSPQIGRKYPRDMPIIVILSFKTPYITNTYFITIR